MESETLQKITDLEYQLNGLWALVIGLVIILLIYFGFSVYYEYKAEKAQKEKVLKFEKAQKEKIKKALNIINNHIRISKFDVSSPCLYWDLTKDEIQIVKEVFDNEIK
jgi:predicted negative regulator of RcsB-dependent stress response